jgi:hypothetical protein
MKDATSSAAPPARSPGRVRAARPRNPFWTRCRQRIQPGLFVATLLLCRLAQAHAEPELRALSQAARQDIEAPPNEKPYDVRHHFLLSNERRHDLFFSALRGIGGGYLGVGADQNYTLAAVARSEVVWLVDIDAEVIDWHKIYAALIPRADRPEALIALLGGRHDDEVKAALAERWEPEEASRLFPHYHRYRHYLSKHLTGERAIVRNNVPVTWMSDPALYAYVRKLMIERRVVARIGDLHGEKTLLGIATASRAAGIMLRTLYLSNVEQWFRYSPQFRRNLLALPRDAKTQVLRTLARGELSFPDQDRWHFSVQPLDDFIAKMEAPVKPIVNVHGLMPFMASGTLPGQAGLSWIGAVQKPPPPPRNIETLPPLRL